MWSLDSIEQKRSEITSEIKDRIVEAYDALIVLGRGIERLHSDNSWVPCQYIQAVDEKGMRTGFREEGLEHDTLNTLVAGAEANIYAAIELFEQMQRAQKLLKLVIFAAGRPAYLESEPEGFSEGTVLKQVFDMHITTPYEYTIQTEDKNTKDDVINSMITCRERGFKKVVLINTEIAMPRTKLFYELWRAQESDPGPQIDFVISENILRQRYTSDLSLLERFEVIQKNLKSSVAWKVTQEREEGGMAAMKAGTYQGKGKY